MRKKIIAFITLIITIISCAVIFIGCAPHKHKYEQIDKISPTCTDDGYTLYRCSECGDELRADKVSALGHQFRSCEGEIVEMPTCTEDGEQGGYKCVRCGVYKDYERVPKLDHDYVDGVCSVCKHEQEFTAQFTAYGKVVETLKFTVGTMDKLSPPRLPQKEGYTDLHWEEYTLGLADIKINLLYGLVEYKITYSGADGAENTNPDTYNVESNIELKPVEKPGYTFDGWYSGDRSIEKIVGGTVGDMVLTAKWTPAEYSIKYENTKNADMSGYPASYTIEDDDITLADLSLAGYTFGGWKNGSETVSVIPNGSIGNLVLTADLTPNIYTVTLEANGGSGGAGSISVEFDSKFSLPVPEKEDHKFLGWFDGEDGDASAVTDKNGKGLSVYNEASDRTYYAKWEINKFTVKFDSNGGSDVAEQIYVTGSMFAAPDDPVKGVSIFDGWYDNDGNRYTSSTTITADVTLTAKWVDSIGISDADGLIAVTASPQRKYYLENDIDLRGTVWTTFELSGELDGRGHTIKNFTVSNNSPYTTSYGFIDINRGTLKNINFADVLFNITVENNTGNREVSLYAGAVVGVNYGTVSGVTLKGGSYMFNYTYASGAHRSAQIHVGAGGIVGCNEVGGTVSDCTMEIDMTARLDLINNVEYDYTVLMELRSCIGGICGYNKGSVKYSTVNNNLNITSHAHCERQIDGVSNGNCLVFAGNLAGRVDGVTENCGASGSISLSSAYSLRGKTYGYIGLLAGRNFGTIKNSYADGDVSGGSTHSNMMGGFIGANEAGGQIQSSYCTAAVDSSTGNAVGGFAGVNDGIIQNSYSTGDVASRSDASIGGFIGSNLNAGTVTKCYSSGSVVTTGGNAGHFVGYDVGSMYKVYRVNGTTIRKGENYATSASDDGTVETVSLVTLWSKEFLVDNLYWDEEGWIILTDEDPLLEFEVTHGHNFYVTKIAPDCTHGGFTVYDCADCGKLFVTDYIDASGHSFGACETIAPTHTESGYTVRKCTVCGYEEHFDTVPATGHSIEGAELKTDHGATCTEDGYYVYHCIECNTDFVVNEKAKGHDGNKVRTEVAPTCTSEGIDIYYCLVCNEEYLVTVECVPHTPIAVKYKAPTCGVVRDDGGNIIERNDPVSGNYAGEKCAVCGKILEGCGEIKPHDYKLVSVTEEPTCSQTGTGVYRCSICEDEKSEELATIDHTDENADYICDVCGALMFTDEILASFTHITDVTGLIAMSENLSANYWLDNDIDLEHVQWTSIGTREKPFKGIFYGANHTISYFRHIVDSQSKNTVGGLFGYNSGTIQCLTVSSYFVEAENKDIVFGGIAAYNSGRIIGCSVDGYSHVKLSVELVVTDYKTHVIELNGSVVGGIVGVNDNNAVVDDCRFTGSLILSCDNTCSVQSEKVSTYLYSLIYSTSAKTVQHVTFGGIVGINEGSLTGCSAIGRTSVASCVDVTLSWMKGKASAKTDLYASALAGYNAGKIVGCSAKRMAFSTTAGHMEIDKGKPLAGKLFEASAEYNNYTYISGVGGILGSFSDPSEYTDCTIVN